MYERSAIVLERYFENLLEYRRECNLRDNFVNYCELIEKLEKYQVNYQKEFTATQDFSESVKKVKSIQELQNKLYKRSVKLEYNRNLLFNNVEAKVEEIRRCIEKVEKDIDQNNEAMKDIRETLLDALTEYNDKRYELSKCKRYKKMAENAYNECIEKTRINFEGITEDVIEKAKEFADFEDLDDVIKVLDLNGKDEKIPFNEGVISNATTFDVELAKKEACGYLVIYYKMEELLNDIDNGTTQVENYKKVLVEEKSKMDFLYAAKDYIFLFLDYERMTVIHGRKSHNRLMNEACENFNQDVQQINNLYLLLESEIENKATKKSYADLYNKSYLKDIQDKEEKFKKEKNRVNLNTATLINSNYWRIDGIKAIYTVFYNSVSGALGKIVDEFDMPKEVDDDTNDEFDEESDNIEYDNNDNNVYSDEQVAEEKVVKKQETKVKSKVPKGPKVPFAIDTTIEDILADADEIDEIDDEELEDENGELDVKSITKKAKQITSKKSNPKKVISVDEEDDEDDEDDEYEEDDDDIIDKDEIEDSADEYDESKNKKEKKTSQKTLKVKKVIKEEVEEVDNDEDENDDSDEEFDIFGEKYKDIDFLDTNFVANKKMSYEDVSEDEFEEDENDEDTIISESLNDQDMEKYSDNKEEFNEFLDKDDEEEEEEEDDDFNEFPEDEEAVEDISLNKKKKSTIPKIRKKSVEILDSEKEEKADETPKRGRRKNSIEELDLESLREAQKALLEITGKKRGRKKKNTEDIW